MSIDNIQAWCIGLLIFVLILIMATIIILLCSRKNETFTDSKVPKIKWPFLNLENEKGENINILVIRAYLDSKEMRKKFLELYEKGWKFIGCSSNQSFPRCCDNPYGSYANCKNKDNQKIGGKDIEEYVLGWCHCFREPEKYIKHNIPTLLCSESDFNSIQLVSVKKLEKKYDYICVQPKTKDCKPGWHHYYKNWPLCEKGIQIMSDELGLKGLIVGTHDCSINIKNKHLIETTDFLHYWKFLDKIRESRFLFLPNLEEASPRIETEALCADVPILVYENILGGWKYVNPETGLFFNENNLKNQVELMLHNIKKNKYNPRKNFEKNFDKVMAGKLRNWLFELYPDMTPSKWVKFSISG